MAGINDGPQTDATLTSSTDSTKSRGSTRWMRFVLIAGVIIPACVVAFELATRMCSSFFDPMPTVWHLVLLAMVPFANLLVLRAFRAADPRYTVLLGFLAGIAVGVTATYSVMFVPFTPIALIGILCMGLGLLGLTPYFALAASIVAARRLKDLGPAESRKRTRAIWAGIALAVVVLGGFMASRYVTELGVRMSASPDPQRSLRGIRLIRTFGSRSGLLRACYSLPADPWISFSMFDDQPRVTPEQARTAYYRVTGDSFNSVPPPRLVGPRSRLVQDFEFDSDVGGTAVNGQVRDLNLSTSRMDARVDPDALTAYTQWTMEFTNSASSDREARMEVALPHGAVVSRLTLWVNGEEREAAFSSRGQVRQAYQQVAVVERHDPVLVTTCGPDRVLVQCFPVPASGGKMKIRLGITSPLTPDGYSKAEFVLPRFVERNFGLPDHLGHSLVIDSPKPVSIGEQNPRAGMVRAQVADADLAGPEGVVVCSRDAGVRAVWSPDKLDPQHYAIVQTIAPSEAAPPRSVAFVIDGSRRLGSARGDIADALRKLPAYCRFTVIQAGEEVTQLTPMQPATPSAVGRAVDAVRRMDCYGGIDNRPALLRAYDIVAPERGIVVWVHGPQPLSEGPAKEQVMQLMERADAPAIIAVCAADGRNTILADLEQTGRVSASPRRGMLRADLERLFSSWTSEQLAVTRQRVPVGQASGLRVWPHIARLWAREEVERVCRMGDSRRLPDASVLAARHQIVTSLSGAVVLETAQQYAENGLKPVDPRAVPSTVPEPASWITLAAGAALVIGRYRRRGQVS